ncbi:MAG TPA: hypothetical protein VLQ79_08860 [Myxococcaceae bacterium]|nr:hypothetical protein [Myxococcaceae bacterium]
MKLESFRFTLGVLTLASTALAQGNISQGAQMTVQVEQSRAANAALLRQYVWNERTDFMVNGQTKDLRIDLVNVAPDGSLQRTVLNDQSSPLPGGFFRRRFAEKEKAQVESYLKGLSALIKQYTLPTPGAVMNLLDNAPPKMTPNGLMVVAGQNVVQPGDSMSIYLDPKTKKTKQVVVTTSYQGDQVGLSCSFNTLMSGLNYPAYSEVTVVAKGYDILVQNFDYNRQM